MIKSYIIRLSDNEFSKKLAKEAYDQAKNLKYDVEYFEGISNKNEISKLFLNYNLFVNKDGDLEKNWGTRGCFISHYLLWRQSYETGEPLLIMEHDGYPIRNPIGLLDEIKHACHLDYHIPFNSLNGDTSKKHFEYYDKAVYEKADDGVEAYPKNQFYGDKTSTGSFFRHAYGYIIKPQGAERVLKFIDEYGVFPADKCLCEKAIKIQRSCATYIRLNKRFKTIQDQRKYTTRTN